MGGHNDTPQIGGADYWAPAAWSVCVCVWCVAGCVPSVSPFRSFKKFMGLVKESESERETCPKGQLLCAGRICEGGRPSPRLQHLFPR